MSTEPRKSHVDQDGIRVSTAGGRAAVTARVLGYVLAGAAVAVVAASATAVWWLRRDPGAHAPPAVTAPVVEPARRVAAHAVRPVASQPQPAEPPTASQRTAPQRATEPMRRGAASTANAAPGPAPAGVRAPAGAEAARPDQPAPAVAPAGDPASARSQEREDREIERMAEDVIAGMRAAGETKGLAAMPPHGTDPVKPGLVVPKDFELPEGYIRHYQTTDDGKRLEAILMFSPDYVFVDDAGKPITLPADRIVTPEMAPPGLPLRILEVPSAHPKASPAARERH